MRVIEHVPAKKQEPKQEIVAPVEYSSPLARRCWTRAMDLRNSVDKVLAKLHTYQSPDAARDLDSTVEVTLRISLESMVKIVEALNAPPAYFPGKAKRG